MITFAFQPEIAGPPEVMTFGLRPLSAALALIPAFLLYLLSRSFPRPYIKAWIAMWLGIAAPLAVGSINPELVNVARDPARLNFARLVVAIYALSWIGGMGLLGLSASWYRQPVRWPRWVAPLSVAVAAWFLVGSIAIGLIAVWAGALVIGGILFLVDAIAFLRLAQRQRVFGALIIGLVLGLVPVNLALGDLTGIAGRPGAMGIWIWTLVYALVALGMHLLVFEDVTWELRQRNEELTTAHAELRAVAITDKLTGCFNRRFFDEIATHEMKRHQRYELPFSVLFFDFDQFKQINDLLGHDMGDRVLETVGRMLRANVRETDYVFRWGGDEFVVLVTGDEAYAAQKAGEICAAFTAHPLRAQLPEGCGLSVGWIQVDDDAVDLQPFVQAADAKMYERKRISGKGDTSPASGASGLPQ